MTQTMSAMQPGMPGQPGRPDAYATVGRRLGAYLLDAAASLLVLLFLGVAPLMLTHEPATVAIGYLGTGVLGLVQWYLVGTRGYSIGKRLLGLRIVDVDTGAPIGMGRAFLRYLVFGLLSSCLILLIVLVFAVKGDPRRQGWHDKAARSVVVDVAVEGAVAPGSRPGAVPVAPPGVIPPPPPPAAPPGGPGAGPVSAAAGQPPSPAAAAPPVPPVPPAPTTPPTTPPVGPPPAAPVVPRRVTEPLPAGGLVPPPPGLVTPPPRSGAESPPAAPAAPARPSPAPTGAAPAAPVDEATRRPHDGGGTPSGAPARAWVLRPRTGAEHRLDGATVIGRDPEVAGREPATAWPVDDPAFTVSKTHALVTLVGGSPWIEDLDSTHGVLIRRNGDEATIAPRTPTRLLPGDVIVLGAFEIGVEALA